LNPHAARFAFYGRVSTEDAQDPAASRGWQLRRANELITPAGGVIVAEYFDIGRGPRRGSAGPKRRVSSPTSRTRPGSGTRS